MSSIIAFITVLPLGWSMNLALVYGWSSTKDLANNEHKGMALPQQIITTTIPAPTSCECLRYCIHKPWCTAVAVSRATNTLTSEALCSFTNTTAIELAPDSDYTTYIRGFERMLITSIGGIRTATKGCESTTCQGNEWNWTFGGRDLPQSVWWELPKPQVVRRFAFKAQRVDQGVTKYIFFGTNAADCSDETAHVILFEDLPGTPFTEDLAPKIGDIANPSSFRCYGFKFIENGGAGANSMKFINLYIMKH